MNTTNNTIKSAFIAKRAELKQRQRDLATQHIAAIKKLNAERSEAIKAIRAERKALYDEYNKSCAEAKSARLAAKAERAEAKIAKAKAKAEAKADVQTTDAEVAAITDTSDIQL